VRALGLPDSVQPHQPYPGGMPARLRPRHGRHRAPRPTQEVVPGATIDSEHEVAAGHEDSWVTRNVNVISKVLALIVSLGYVHCWGHLAMS